nr:hypothetical protein CFP56_66874 [Quercus suber]
MRTGIWDDLPVLMERRTFGQSGDDDDDEGDEQEDPDALQGQLIAAPPDANGDALQELGDGQFAHPDVGGVEDAGGQDQARTDLAVPQLGGGEGVALGLDVVGAVDQDDVYAGHADEQRDHGRQHDPIFTEQDI